MKVVPKNGGKELEILLLEEMPDSRVLSALRLITDQLTTLSAKVDALDATQSKLLDLGKETCMRCMMLTRGKKK